MNPINRLNALDGALGNILQELNFVKLHGNGNDFVLIDCIKYPIYQLFAADPIQQLAAIAPQLSDRKTGIGFDQMLIVTGGFHSQADFGCAVINADGSIAGNCMNGSRAIAYYLWREKLMDTECLLSFQTVDIKLNIAPQTKTEHHTIQVKSQVMGNVNFLPISEFSHTSKVQLQAIIPPAEGQILGLVELGNYHLVIQVQNQADHLMPMAAQLQDGTQYGFQQLKHGVNVLFFMLPADADINNVLVPCRVFERGVGETQACGSAAAAAAVAFHNHFGADKLPCTLKLPGGRMRIGMDDAWLPWVEGDATWVYSGCINIT